MKIHDLPPYKRPREKLLTRGADGLTPAELLAILLRTGYQGKSALEVAHRILKTTSLSELLKLSVPELARIKGIGPSRACLLVAAKALAQFSQSSQPAGITKPEEVAALMTHVTKFPQEHVVVLYVNARNQLLDQRTISIGTVNAAMIHARDVFAPAIEQNASGLILVHNHPSQDPSPSEEDILVTEKLVEAGQLLDIPVLDHLIVTKRGWTSFKQQALL